MTRDDEPVAAMWIFMAIVIVVGANKLGHPLAAGLALFPLRWAVARIVAAARQPAEEWGQHE
jgi:hypothetical protein